VARVRCVKCKRLAVRGVCRPGRTVGYRNLGAIPVPPDFPIPTCSRCGAEYSPNVAILETCLRPSYLAELRRRAALSVPLVCCSQISQRKLELLLGLSQGYLSRLKAEAGTPSAALVSLLHLLAIDPNLLRELQRFWLLPQP
jgi:hypothetical protein